MSVWFLIFRGRPFFSVFGTLFGRKKCQTNMGRLPWIPPVSLGAPPQPWVGLSKLRLMPAHLNQLNLTRTLNHPMLELVDFSGVFSRNTGLGRNPTSRRTTEDCRSGCQGGKPVDVGPLVWIHDMINMIRKMHPFESSMLSVTAQVSR